MLLHLHVLRIAVFDVLHNKRITGFTMGARNCVLYAAIFIIATDYLAFRSDNRQQRWHWGVAFTIAKATGRWYWGMQF